MRAIYEKLEGSSIALRAARALVFEGLSQPNGYTEPLLHKFRQEKKADQLTSATLDAG
jgi:malate synthase